MKRPVTSARVYPVSGPPRRGYTLVEILVATVLTLLMMTAVVQIFGHVGQSVSDSRATLEMSESLRGVAETLQRDLAGVTVTMLPPRHPESAEGYFEYIEGPLGVLAWLDLQPDRSPSDCESGPMCREDPTVGDLDDILMFTTRSSGQPFRVRVAVKRELLAGEDPHGIDSVGEYVSVPLAVDAEVAEVVWFVRGCTLYRRVLLIKPGLDLDERPGRTLPPPDGFFADNDISVRQEGGALVANTLGDLTMREYRFAHGGSFPFSPHDRGDWNRLRLPTLRECSYIDPFDPDNSWQAGAALPLIALTLNDPVDNRHHFDAWYNPYPWKDVLPTTGTYRADQPNDQNEPLPVPPPRFVGRRIAEDVILTHVIGFDVKVWDPEVGAYVNLGYREVPYAQRVGHFDHNGEPRSGLTRVYDTWSFHYEHDGVDQFGDGKTDLGTNGFDDDAPNYDDDGDGQVDEGEGETNGVVDDAAEMETSPPYPVPLRGIQVKIRVFEPDSRRIREITVVQDFLPK